MATMAERIAAMQSAFSKTSGSGNYYNFWNMDIGQKVVMRFLPDLNENNPKIFMQEKVLHSLYINGERQTVPCLSMYKEECPICKASADYYSEGDDVKGKKFWKQRYHVVQALIIEDPLSPQGSDNSLVGKVKLVSFSAHVFNVIKEAIAANEFDGPLFDYDTGHDFIIKKTANGDTVSYIIGTKFANRSRALTPEEREEADGNSIDLSTVVIAKNPGIEKTQQLLNSALLGLGVKSAGKTSSVATDSFDGNGDEDETPAPKPKAKSKPVVDDEDDDDEDETPAPKPKAKSKPVVDDEDDDDDSEDQVAKMLASIKKRNQKKKEAVEEEDE